MSTNTKPPPLRRNKSSLRLLTELSRERVSLRYLHSWVELYNPEYINRNAFPAENVPTPAPAACNDTALAAFAQLAALRIGVRRAFITLVSRQTEYVLAEGTRTMSLQSDFTSDERDRNWLGTACFARSDGINDVAMDQWRKARSFRQSPADAEHYYTQGTSDHWCIVSDVKQDASLAKRAFVRRARTPRFYFSVPLRDADGSVVGSLSMLDDKPRYGVSAEEMSFCEDLSDTIAQHLRGTMITLQRERSEKLIQALGTFNSGGGSLREWWIGQKRGNMERGGWQKNTDEAGSARDNTIFDHEFGVRRREPIEQHSVRKDERLSESVGQDSRQAITGQSQQSDDDISTGSIIEPPSSRPQELESAHLLENAHSRASNLLRESMGAAGVIFFDASSAALRFRGKRSAAGSRETGQTTESSSSNGTTSTSSEESKAATNSDTDTSDGGGRRSKLCSVEGSSIQTQVITEGRGLQLTERDLVKLIKTYPHGRVFNYAADGGSYSGSDDSAGSGASSESAAGTNAKSLRVNNKHSRHARMLRRVVGDCRSIAFYPMWDDNDEAFRTCIVAWSTHSSRFFDTSEDVTYLSAFAHSLRAETRRIELIASDIAKGRFISSVSHELRSPLHGVLAGIELIQDSKLTPFQEEMAQSVAIAGRTLLDTVNNILDYSKISNLTREQQKDHARVDASRHKSADVGDQKGDLMHVDIARLTEEVVESCVSAHRYSKLFGKPSAESNESTPEKKTMRKPDGQDVSVTLNITPRGNWTTAVSPGTWTRIISNIVNNALKFTQDGVIAIKLSADKHSAIPGDTEVDADDDTTYVSLQVVDSGIGISQRFLRSGLFTPFKQADPHAVGTGLGLSIVRELAMELNVSLDVQSELGKGTSFLVRFKARFPNVPEDPEISRSEPPPPAKPRHLCVLDMREDGPVKAPYKPNAVSESVKHIATHWLRCETSSSRASTPDPRATLCAISEDDLCLLDDTAQDSVKNMVSTLAAAGTQVLVLGRSAASSQPAFNFEAFGLKPIYIHQPIGPRKLQRAITSAQSSTFMRQPSDHALHSVRRASVPRTIRGDTPSTGTVDETATTSYFELSRIPEDGVPSTSNSLITPLSFSEMSKAQTPGQSVSGNPQIKGLAQDETVDDAAENTETVVLLVEDNFINMKLLVALMKRQALRYDCAENGLVALQKYNDNPRRYFLILMDMSMPVMDGFESTAKIRASESKKKIRNVYITALTGVTSEEARTNAMKAGVNRYLTKPMRMKDLSALVAETRDASGH